MSTQLKNTLASLFLVSDAATRVHNINFGSNNCDVVDYVLVANVVAEKLKNMKGEDTNEFCQLVGVDVRQDIQGSNSCEQGRAPHACYMFDKMSNSNGLCTASCGSSHIDKGLFESQGRPKSSLQARGLIQALSFKKKSALQNGSKFIKHESVISGATTVVPSSCVVAHGSKGWVKFVAVSTNDKDGRTEESNAGSFSSSGSYGGQSLNYSDNSHKIGGHISTNSYGEGVPAKEWGEMVINGSIGQRLKHYSEGPKKISHYVLQLCFIGFDKKIRCKGSGDPLIIDEHFVMDKEFEGNIKLPLICVSNLISANDNLETIAPDNNLSLIISLSCALVYHGMSVNRDELSAMDKDYAGNVRLLAVRPFNMSSAIGNSEILASGNSSKFTFALVFEHELEKMSLVLVDKFKKMEGDARMVFDDICGRWKFIAIDADEYCDAVLHVKFLEHCMKPNEKCSGYLLSTFYAPLTMQKLGYKFKYQYVLQLHSSFYNMFVMGGTYPSLELLQKENQTDQVDVKAFASAIIQLHLTNSMRVSYKSAYFIIDQVTFAGFSYGVLSEHVASEHFSCLIGPTTAGEIGVCGCISSVLMDIHMGWLYIDLRDKELIKLKSTYDYRNPAWLHLDPAVPCHNMLRNGFDLAYKWETEEYGDQNKLVHPLHMEFLRKEDGVAILEALKYISTEGDHRKALKFASFTIFYEIHQGHIGEFQLQIAAYKSLTEVFRCCTNDTASLLIQLLIRVFSKKTTTHEEAKFAYLIGSKFARYLSEFYRYLEMDLQNFEDYPVCAISECDTTVATARLINNFLYLPIESKLQKLSLHDVMMKSRSRNVGNFIVKLWGRVVGQLDTVVDTTNSCCLHLYMLFVFLLMRLEAGMTALVGSGRPNVVQALLAQSSPKMKVLSPVAIGITVWGIWHVIRGVEENLIEDTTALCNDADGLSLIKAQMLIGDAFMTGELVCDDDYCIIPIESRVSHLGEDLNLTNFYLHMVQSMCWLQTPHSTVTLDETNALFTSISNHRNSSIVHLMMIFVICKLGNWEGSHGYFVDLAAFKTCLFLVFTTWHEAIVAVCAMSLII